MDKNPRAATEDLVQFFALDDRDRLDDRELRHRVACQLLGPIQRFLPQCAVIDAAGRLCLTRQPLPPIVRTVVPLPQHLLLINWADSAPGVSWPEDYYVTFVPEHDRFIVTASMASVDIWGVTDLAIGSFPGNEPIMAASGVILRAWWSLYGELGPWAYVWREALVDWDTAYRWRDAVWAPAPEEASCTDLN